MIKSYIHKLRLRNPDVKKYSEGTVYIENNLLKDKKDRLDRKRIN